MGENTRGYTYYTNPLANSLLDCFYEALKPQTDLDLWDYEISVPEDFKFEVADKTGAIYKFDFYLKDLQYSSAQHDKSYRYCFSAKAVESGQEVHCLCPDVDWGNFSWEWREGSQDGFPLKEVLTQALSHLRECGHNRAGQGHDNLNQAQHEAMRNQGKPPL